MKIMIIKNNYEKGYFIKNAGEIFCTINFVSNVHISVSRWHCSFSMHTIMEGYDLSKSWKFHPIRPNNFKMPTQNVTDEVFCVFLLQFISSVRQCVRTRTVHRKMRSLAQKRKVGYLTSLLILNCVHVAPYLPKWRNLLLAKLMVLL